MPTPMRTIDVVAVLAVAGLLCSRNGLAAECVAHTVTRGSSHPALAVGSAHYQATVSLGQRSVVGPPQQPAVAALVVASGFQAATAGCDNDSDGLADIDDPDDNDNGTPDAQDPRPYDSDNDGANNLADADDDNDLLVDLLEWQAGTDLLAGDTDRDGQGDYAEWVAGTGGTDASDTFAITNVRPGPCREAPASPGAQTRADCTRSSPPIC